VGLGVFLDIILLVALVVVGLSALSTTWLGSAASVVGRFGIFAGFSQWLFVLPLAFGLRKWHRPRTAKGLLIAAAVVCFLQTACWGVLLSTGAI
jgi:hypothetical protein